MMAFRSKRKKWRFGAAQRVKDGLTRDLERHDDEEAEIDAQRRDPTSKMGCSLVNRRIIASGASMMIAQAAVE